ncbi:MAG: glycosyltransferase family 2 protein [Chitinophagales bacterium]|nr:glycosyltransferase family 2 protein [Chitinophagales bacterium]
MKFSIVLPTYNRADMISTAIQSVLNQTYDKWELIIMDDGSTDNTHEIVSKYLHDNRIQYIYQQNTERSTARNNGIKRATGDYVCFLDSDDYYTPDRLMALAHSIPPDMPVAMYYTGALIQQEGKVFKQPMYPYKSGNVFGHLITYAISTQQACIHRSIFQTHTFHPKINIGEDMELWLRIATQFPVVCFDDQFTIVIVSHGNRSIASNNNAALRAIKTMEYIQKHSPARHHISPGVLRARISGYWFQSACHLITAGKRLRAAAHLLKALVYAPFDKQAKYRLHVFLKLLMPFYPSEKLISLVTFNTSSAS